MTSSLPPAIAFVCLTLGHVEALVSCVLLQSAMDPAARLLIDLTRAVQGASARCTPLQSPVCCGWTP